MQRLLFPVVTIAFVAVLGACGSSGKHSTSTPVGGSPTTTTQPAGSIGTAAGSAITIRSGSGGFAFVTSAVRAGSKVTVKNLSAAQHTVSADTTLGGFDVTIDAGGTPTFNAPSKPGAYGFHCNIHNYMRATLTVT